MKAAHIKTILVITGLLVALLLPASSAAAQDDAVVYGVLLYSPECPHCHEFINNDWPVMHAEFGDQFVVLFVDVLTGDGQALAGVLYDHYGVPAGERYVPMMFIGDEVLVGGLEIPQRGSELVRAGIAAGGIDMPPVPAVQDAFEQALSDEADPAAATTEQEAAPSSAADETLVSTASAIDQPAQEDRTFWQRLSAKLARDPIANALAVMVLLGMTASVGAVLVTGVSLLGEGDDAPAGPDEEAEEDFPIWWEDLPGQALTVLSAVIGAALAAALLVRTGDDTLALVMSVGALVGLLATAVLVIVRPEARLLAIFVTAAAGLLVAIYLSVVEVGGSAAVCGAVGDCTTVQNSPYAMLFGVLPVGVLGIMGYLMIGIAGIVAAMGGKTWLGDWGRVALLALTLVGVGFSIYLTFLEPFVIGATCFWCLTSAMAMLVILWLIAPPGWESLRRIVQA